jgi:L-malate glycosyltransferase
LITILHITPHLGGGVGKALSGLIVQTQVSAAPVNHKVVCLEKPEKNLFIERILESSGEVIIAPTFSRIDELVSTADIIQVEWWNHPATIEYLCNMVPQSIRLLVWCHVSGLHNPIIPTKLIENSNRILFTSPCSLAAKQVSAFTSLTENQLSVVSSGGGFAGLPEPRGDNLTPLSVGYFGSLNFAKLHPAYVEFLSAVNLPTFKVRLIGDLLNREILEGQSDDAGRSGMLEFRGYTTDVIAELKTINVMAYLLNPQHYGTAENALLEAMAMGIVPIVLDNPAENNIVEHQRTGFIVRNSNEFADAIEWLANNPKERSRMGMQAAASIRTRFTLEKMEASFRTHYKEVMKEQKRLVQFQHVFGTTPEEWFLSCQAEPEIFREDGEICPPASSLSYFNLLEKSKGSVFHFLSHFPDAARLQTWAKNLESQK